MYWMSEKFSFAFHKTILLVIIRNGIYGLRLLRGCRSYTHILAGFCTAAA